MKRIAIQGFNGSFHDLAAHEHFQGEQIQLICCATFEQVYENIKRDPTVIGMVAIENTIAGSLLHNYELLRDSGTTIAGPKRAWRSRHVAMESASVPISPTLY